MAAATLESDRLSALYSLRLLDTPAEERFDRITRVAAARFDTAISTADGSLVPDIRAIARMARERVGGWEVTAAGSAAEAEAAVRELRPDVVLLDVMMPDVDGPATLARLRPLLGDGTPVIFLTAKPDGDRLLALGRRA